MYLDRSTRILYISHQLYQYIAKQVVFTVRNTGGVRGRLRQVPEEAVRSDEVEENLKLRTQRVG